jgi:hypothetical protein
MDTDSVRISDITHHGVRITRGKVVRAAGPEAAKIEAERAAGRNPGGRVVGIGRR